MVESADTFASPELAEQLSRRSPLLAALLQSFNEEFNGYLIFPTNRRLFSDGNVLDSRSDEEKVRFERDVAVLWKSHGVGAYCKALVEDTGLWAKVAGFKRSTVRAFASGTVDMPLCDQVCFMYEWLQVCKAAALNMGPTGEWWVDPQTGYSGVADSGHPHTLGIPARQPRLAEPQNVEVLLDVRNALEEHLLRHLDRSMPTVTDYSQEPRCGDSCRQCFGFGRQRNSETSAQATERQRQCGVDEEGGRVSTLEVFSNSRRYSRRAAQPSTEQI